MTEYSTAETLSENNIVIQIKNIKETALFKGINNVSLSFIPLDSSARVEIEISYFNNTLGQNDNVYFTIYDSKCRECINKETSILSVRTFSIKYLF